MDRALGALLYSLCALTSLVAFVLLLRSWRATRFRLLFWSALCFAGLTINNFLLVLDKLVFLQVNLTTLRLVAGLVSILQLLFGLIWEEE